MLAVAELVTSSSYIVAGINFIANFSKGDGNQCENVCKIQCFVTTWFSMSGNIWTGILVIHFYLILSLGVRRAGVIGKLMPIYYTIAFVCPLTIVMPLLGTGDLKCFSSGVGTMHHPTALSVVTFVIAGPFWVILTFAVITVSYILISVKLVKYGRIHAVSYSTDHICCACMYMQELTLTCMYCFLYVITGTCFAEESSPPSIPLLYLTALGDCSDHCLHY